MSTDGPAAGTAHTTAHPGRVQPVGSVPNRVGLAMVAVGAVLGVLALTVLNWFRGNLALVHGSQSTAGDLGDLLDRLVTERRVLDDQSAIHLGLSDYYFSWLAWLLLAALVIVAVVAALPSSENGPVRMLAALLALLGIGATLWSLDVYRPAHDHRVAQGPSYADYLSHTSYGAWAAFAAFVLIGAGAVLGPGRAPTPTR